MGGLQYRDAVKLLGVGQSKTVAALDAIFAGGLIGAAISLGSFDPIGLFDAKSEAARYGQQLAGRLGQRARGVRGQARMDLLAAAHTVLVLSAFFESLPEMANGPASLVEQFRLVGSSARNRRGLADTLIGSEVPIPLPQLTQAENRERVRLWYQEASRQITVFFTSSAAGGELLHVIDGSSKSDLVDRALTRYDEHYLALCRDCPEFALWSLFREHAAGRAELKAAFGERLDELSSDIGTGLDGLRSVLESIRSTSGPADWPDRLSRCYLPMLAKPIADVGAQEALAGMRMPSLEEAYVNPSCRVAGTADAASIANDSWWDDQRLVDDVEAFLLPYLTSPAATTAPLVVLGQPGSGKSVLTRILAARLPSEDFLPVRVELRQVPADDPVQDQIELAVRSLTGNNAEWPEIVESAEGALPVVILDGLDELLQSTRVAQSNYLEQIQKFQQREARQGRSVAVIVTSRTVVADRVRYPAGTAVIRVEPFDRGQVKSWLTVWNTANAGYFESHDLRPLGIADAMRQRDLASQPLLLLLLALYDADGNRLPRGAGTLLAIADLYERLLEQFVRRETAKNDKLDAREFEQEVARELHRLSIVALAMFNRGRVYAHDDEINADLAALPGTGRPETGSSGLRRAYTEGELMVGRFFFVHESLATRGPGDRAATYEFLHATFGEYLVARLIGRLVDDAARRASAAANDLYASAVDDSWLAALLGWKPLTSRQQVLTFLRAQLAAKPAARDLLLRVFHHPEAGPRPPDLQRYRPLPTPEPAIYRLNILLLLLCLGEVRATELFPGETDVVEPWQRLAHLWRAHCNWTAWFDLISTVTVERIRGGESRDLRLSIAAGGAGDVELTYDGEWWAAGEAADPSGQWTAAHLGFLCEVAGDRLYDAWSAIAPELRRPGNEPLARTLVELRLGNLTRERQKIRFRGLVPDGESLDDPIDDEFSPHRLAILQLRDDLSRTPDDFLSLVDDWSRELDQDIPPLSLISSSALLATLLAESAVGVSDPRRLFVVMRRCQSCLLPRTVSASWTHMYLRLWVSQAEAGIDPSTIDGDWEDADIFQGVDFRRLAADDTALLLRLAQAVARTGYGAAKMGTEVAEALLLVPAHALCRLSAAEVERLAEMGPRARLIEAWRQAKYRLERAAGELPHLEDFDVAPDEFLDDDAAPGAPEP
jgi:hypothetical protein